MLKDARIPQDVVISHHPPTPAGGVEEEEGEWALTQAGGTSFHTRLRLDPAAPAKTRAAQWDLGLIEGTHSNPAWRCSREARKATYFPLDLAWPVGEAFTLWMKVRRTLRHL